MLYFEDDCSIFPLTLLRRIVDIDGFHGSGNVSKKLSDSDVTNAIVYFDLCADNKNAVKQYSSVVSTCIKLDNVYVVPIPCVEYIFIRAFIGYTLPESELILNFGDYRELTRSSNGRQIYNRNFEKTCKSIVRNTKVCFRNGVFDTKDCVCFEKPVDLTCNTITLTDKGYKLLYSLPCHNSIAVKQAVEVGERWFYTMAENFKKFGIIDYIPKLPSQF